MVARVLIPFETPLREATLLRRYKRFLADIRLPDGQEITVHCPNTGSMRNCGQPGDRVWVSLDYKPGRKLPGTWELVEIGSGQVACIHSARANRVVAQALQQGLITTLAGYPEVRAEVRSSAQIGHVCPARADAVYTAKQSAWSAWPHSKWRGASPGGRFMRTTASYGPR